MAVPELRRLGVFRAGHAGRRLRDAYVTGAEALLVAVRQDEG
ncbi:hypothetical protein [Roseomonas alba]|nr:hypothetical protein [Neoroseomonas alba]